MIRRAALVAGALTLVASCKGPGPATIDGAVLAQADGNYELPAEGTTVVLGTNGAQPPRDLGPVVKLAADGEVPFGVVRAMKDDLEAQGKTVHLVVGQRRKVRGFRLTDELAAGAEHIRVVASTDGKACVAPPGSPEAKCVQSGDKQHISRAYVRELTREAMKGYALYDVEAYVPGDMSWADAVRLIDGVRTCCFDVEMRIDLAE